MKKIFLLISMIAVLGSCSDSFLDTQNLTKKDSGIFPVSTSDAEEVLTAMYRPIMGNANMPQSSSFLTAELMSDDRLAGGGTDDHDMQAIASFTKTSENMYASFWDLRWEGIYRANFLLQQENRINWDNDGVHNRIIGETYFLRAYYYFELARAFGNVPLVLTPDPQNNPQATPEVMYGQIAADLLQAINLLPADKWKTGVGSDGHATKWAGEAMLARVFLFYTGYYNQSAIKLPGDGGELTKDKVIGYIDDCVAQSGHSLLPEFRNLWPYSAVPDYTYNVSNHLSWIGEDGNNPEAVMVIKHSGAEWEARNNEALFFSLRYQDEGGNKWMDCYPYGEGWGVGPVNCELYENWPKNDPRRTGSILNVDDPNEGFKNYVDGAQNQVQDTHLWNKKYTAISTKADDATTENYLGKGIEPLYWHLYPSLNTLDYQSNNLQDFYLIRFSDVLLMGAELGSGHAQEYLDRVRKRVGLASVPVTAENIQNERRWELAFEGIRYYDLLRWHKEDLITTHRHNVKVRNQKKDATLSLPFRKETHGFLPIPDEEIQKSQGVLIQNEGWKSDEGNF
ncbi:RagB/SusD family nutrient uptake outer membrane protein [Prevotella sp.]|uniref:RagB/SusD family nutrient uptake outer membrane protein n=1 Tax=Prevotella sp. TaxID=59823 RepID=UPI002F928E0E